MSPRRAALVSRLASTLLLIALGSMCTPFASGRSAVRPVSRERATKFRRLHEALEGGNSSIREASSSMSLIVGLMTDQSQARITANRAFTIQVGQETFEAASGEIWKAVLLRGVPAQIEYLPVIRSFSFDEQDEALALSRYWKDRGFASKTLIVGEPLALPAGRIHDGRRIYVVVGIFESEDEARSFMNELRDLGESPWLHRNLVETGSGTLALLDPTGTVRAQGSGAQFSRVVSDAAGSSQSSLKVFDVMYDQGLPGAGSEDREYDGQVRVVFDKDGRLAVVNDIDLESYLCGVVPSEVYASDPMETLKSQSIAARSKTLIRLSHRNPTEPFDICSDQYCQVYRGLGRQDPRTSAAVEQTAGKILWEGNRIVPANFADSCGGHTESSENVWSSPADPALTGVTDAPPGDDRFPGSSDEVALASWLKTSPPSFCQGDSKRPNPTYRWSRSFTESELAQQVAAVSPIGSIREMIPTQRGVSGRLVKLTFVGTRGQVTVQRELTIRRLDRKSVV